MSFRSPRALPWAILAITAVAAFGAYLHFVSTAGLPIDESWRSAVRLTPGTMSFTIAAFLAEIGTTMGVATCGAVSAALLLAIRQRREAAVVITALLIGVATSQLLKFLVERPRPLEAVYVSHGSSYPSGHSMGAAALAFSLAYVVSSLHHHQRAHVSLTTVRWTWALAVLWTVAMMWSRTALGVHWFTDTVAGALIGFASAVIAQSIWGRPRLSPGSKLRRQYSGDSA